MSSYVLDQSGEQLTTLDQNQKWVRTNVYAGGQQLATYDFSAASGTIPALHFQLTDPLGTRRVQASSSGEAELDCQSLPFGDQQYCFVAPKAPESADDATPLHFTGKERDTESGNDYFLARYYGSSMGRFLSPDDGDGGDNDPSNPQSWNLYSYVQNNPLSSTDPDGHDCVTQTRTSSTTESVSVSSGTCSGNVGDGQTQTYVNGTVTGISVNGGNSLDIGYNSYDGQSSGVTNAGAAPIPDNPGLAYGYGNNAQGYNTLGAANKAVNYATAGAVALYAGAIFAPQIAAGGAAALATGRALYYAAAGLLPAVPSAIEKLQKLGMSISEANELIESPGTQKLVDNANSGNINYIADVGGKLVRITTDPNGHLHSAFGTQSSL